MTHIASMPTESSETSRPCRAYCEIQLGHGAGVANCPFDIPRAVPFLGAGVMIDYPREDLKPLVKPLPLMIKGGPARCRHVEGCLILAIIGYESPMAALFHFQQLLRTVYHN